MNGETKSVGVKGEGVKELSTEKEKERYHREFGKGENL